MSVFFVMCYSKEDFDEEVSCLEFNCCALVCECYPYGDYAFDKRIIV